MAIRWGSSLSAEVNQTRTLLNPYMAKVNLAEIFRAARKLTSGLDSRGIQRGSDMVVWV